MGAVGGCKNTSRCLDQSRYAPWRLALCHRGTCRLYISETARMRRGQQRVVGESTSGSRLFMYSRTVLTRHESLVFGSYRIPPVSIERDRHVFVPVSSVLLPHSVISLSLIRQIRPLQLGALLLNSAFHPRASSRGASYEWTGVGGKQETRDRRQETGGRRWRRGEDVSSAGKRK